MAREGQMCEKAADTASRLRQERKEDALARVLDKTGFRYRAQPCGQGNEHMQFVIYRLWGIMLLQCAPEKHCLAQDEAVRVWDAFAAQVRRGHFDEIRLIRFNPDSYAENGVPAKTRMKDRYEALQVAILEEPTKHFSVRYMFFQPQLASAGNLLA